MKALRTALTLALVAFLALSAAAEAQTKGFRQAPSVSLTTSKTSVEADKPALLTLSMINPTINDVSLTVQAILKVPSGVSISATSFVAGGSNQFTGDFVVPPGAERHVTIQITSDEVGDKLVESQIIYYPAENKDAYQQLQQTIKVEVKEKSKQLNPPPIDDNQTAKSPSRTPGFEAALGLAALLAVALLATRRR